VSGWTCSHPKYGPTSPANEQHLPGARDESRRPPQETPQTLDRLDHPNPVAEKEQRVERTAIELEDVDADCVNQTATIHHLHRPWRDVDGRDVMTSQLEFDAV